MPHYRLLTQLHSNPFIYLTRLPPDRPYVNLLNIRNGRMPVEHLRVTLKPNNFFKWSPALDVKPADDAHSMLAFGTGTVLAEPPLSNGANSHHATVESPSCAHCS